MKIWKKITNWISSQFVMEIYACECPDYEMCNPHYGLSMHTVPGQCKKKRDGVCKKICECKESD